MRILRFPSLALVIALVLALSLSLGAAAKAPDSSQQTYTVLVGWENPHQGIGIMAYFPDTVTIHVGDTVHWVQNSNEIHTVTFLAGTEPPPLLITATQLGVPPDPSPLLLNPAAVDPVIPAGGLYDGTSFANSGLMGREPGESQQFDLTFTAEGTYDYLCLVHGVVMSGQVVVVGQEVSIPSPNQAMAQGKQQMAEKLAQVPAVQMEAEMQVQPPVMNDNGTMTHHVMIGYNDGQIDLMQFFPDKLVVSPGDTVEWEMSLHNVAPHTVTFLNGEPALARLGEERFDVVVTDYKMKGIDGMEILRKVKQLYPETSVIMITAFANLDTAIEAFRGDVHDFFPKPVKIKELKASIQRALEKKQA